MGSLAGAGVDLKAKDVDSNELRRAVIYGSVMGSFCCERFGVERFRTLIARRLMPVRRVQRIYLILRD